AFFDEDYTVPGKMNARRGGFLERVDTFDPLFFGITPREAAQMDPQQRLMLELAWEAIEDAGVIPETLRGSRTGVFCGLTFNDYSILKSRIGVEAITPHTTVGSIASIVANRISYAFGLEGPSMSLDTACSSSLVAVHLACQSLRIGESNLALAGGVNLMLAPDTAIALSQIGALSPDGRCHTFDAGANGFARAEGGGVIVLKRLPDAIRDGDPIYCVIRGSAVNNDGASNGLTAPSPKAQESVIRDACRNAGIDPATVHYVETHGTGTPIGDPIETASLGAVYGVNRSDDRPLMVGSAKTTIGHLEAAAGITGVVKVALSLKHSFIPANLHFNKPSSSIDFAGLRLKVVDQLQPWTVLPDERRRGAVSGFGIGGTNAHIVLEDLAPQKTLLLIGGDDASALRANVSKTLEALTAGDPSLNRLSSELLQKTNQPQRVAVLAESPAELQKTLQTVLENKPGKGVFRREADAIAPQDPVWVFSGVGGQWLGMGCSLMNEQPVFRATLERFAKEIERHLGWSLFAELTADASNSRLERIDVLWPSLCAFQVALADQWRALGIKPAAVIGHSLGEIAAAYVAGVLSLEEGASIACHWSRLVEQARGNGAMALVALGWDEAQEVIAAFENRITRGVNASPSTTILTGDVLALDEVVAQLTERGVFARHIAVPVAAHNSRMEASVAELPSLLSTLRPAKAQVPFVSTNTGALITGEELGGSYWGRQFCEPVRFAQGIACLIEQGYTVFLECNPHPVMQKAIEECLADSGKSGIVVASLYRDEHEGNSLREALANLYVHGATVAGESDSESGEARTSLLLPLSGRKEQAKRDYARSLADYLERSSDTSLNDICYTASVRRTHHSHRAAIVAATRTEFVNALNAVANGENHGAVIAGKPRASESSSVAFIYPGQGSQWLGMGQQLLQQEPVFRAAVERCEPAIRKYTDWSVMDELRATEVSSQLHRVDVVQPTLFAVAVGLTELWRSWGIAPSAVVGHSMGEVAASYIAGALSLDDAARIICLRSKLLRRVSGQGVMAVTELPRSKAEEYLRGYEDRVSIAVCNSPSSTVLSGEPAAIDEILSKLEAQDIFCRRVKVDVASHSPQMDPLRPDLLAALSELKPRSGSVPIYSTVVGEVCDGSQFDANYWANNLRRPVQFAGAIESLLYNGFRTFLEVSPHPLLSGNIREVLKYRGIDGAAVSSLHRDEDERSMLHKGLAALHCSGQPVKFASLYPNGGRVVSLPAYAWQRERHWLPEASPSNVVSVQTQAQSLSPIESAPVAATANNSGARLFFHNGWEHAPLNESTGTSNASGSILIFGTDQDVLKNGRIALGGISPIVLVQPGDRYRELGGLRYEIDPRQAGHYQQLIESLAQSNLLPSRVVYCWAADYLPSEENEVGAQLEQGVYSILHLTQALLEAKPAHAIHLWYVFTTTQNQVLPQHAALSGSFKTVRQENPQFVFKTLEIRNEKPTATSAGLWELMSRELSVARNNEFEVRYQNDSRYARRLKEVELEDKTQPSKNVLPVKNGGVYLITGGAGGLGLLFAEHLARQERVKLVLTGRSSLSATKVARIERLKELGAEVAYIQNDISQRDQALALVNETRSRFGTINGVLHCAGNLNRSFVSKKQPDGVASILAPKVYGTINLDDVLKNDPLDFFIFFSSISAVKGYEGLFDYAYGNSFMDHFAELRENLRSEQRRFGRSISINWSLWQDGGMQLAQDEAALFLEQTGLEVLTLREGGKLLDVCATQDQVRQCLVGFGDRDKFNEFLNPQPVRVESVNQPTATASQPIDASLLREKVSAYLTGKLAEVTGLPADEFDPQERFVTYGIDSVIVHRFNAKLSKDLGPVSKTLLFENKNIDELTNYFATHHATVLSKLLGLQPAPTPPVAVEQPGTPPPPAVVVVEAKAEQPCEATASDHEIAIIGISGRYPHANNLDQFWKNLKSGRDCIGEIHSDRWDYRNYYDPNPNTTSEGKTYSKWAGLVDDVEKFDPLFFNLSVKEAESMDPQERLLLEIGWTAFEDAGYSRKRLRSYVQDNNGTDVGVFVGCTSNTHMMLGPAEWEAGNHALPLSMPWSLANRVSHVLDLHGPSLPVDTGCVSSLTAVHLACESLKTGECSMALAGGVNLVLHPSKFLYPTKYRMLSPTGRCRAFGRDADGIVIGEGAGAVVLKRLRDALRDGDRIYAIIKGTASNHGGQVNGYTVPSPQAQASLILQSLDRANVDARTVSCIEAHGTGTALGDPIEVAGLTKAFREYTPDKQFCTLGSVKSNIGHLEGAAGIAGLTKVLLQMKHRQFVPSLHAEATNPDIDFDESPFYVRSELSEWQQPVVCSNGETKTFPRRAGISSFGAGGSNAQVLIEEYVDQTALANTPSSEDACLFLLSARSEERLRVYASSIADSVESALNETKEVAYQPGLADIAYTLQVGREPLEERLAVVAQSHHAWIEALRAFAENKTSDTPVRRSTIGRSTITAAERKELAENIGDWLKRGQLSLLSEAWLKGLDVDWKQLPQNMQRRTVPLPTYPFLRDRVWIHDRAVLCEPPERVVTSSRPPALHPLIDSNESTLSEERFRKLLTGDEFFLRDHRIGDHLVLPGVAIIEMARAAGEIAAERRVAAIRNIVFSSPVSIAREAKAFFVSLQPVDEAVDFQVYSLKDDGQRETHTQGKLVYESPEPVAPSEWIDIEGIREHCNSIVDSAAGYEWLSGLGLQLGPSFQPVGDIFCNEIEAISRLELPAHLKDTFNDFVLHPCMMDGAQQVTGLTKLLGKDDRVRVPFAIGEIEVLDRITPVCYAHVKLIGGRDALNSANRKFDVRLVDETGRVLVKIKQFQTRAFTNRSSEPRSIPESTDTRAATSEAFYFEERWDAAPAGRSKSNRPAIGTVLLFDTGDQLRDALRARLQEEAGGRVNVVLVKPGKTFRSFGEHGYTIDPQRSSDYQRLFEGLKGRDRMPDSIVHLWSRDSYTGTLDHLNDQLTNSVYSIHSLVQGLLEHKPSKHTQLLYAFYSDDEASQPPYAALRGFAATLQKESPKLSCKSIEFRGSFTSSTSQSDDEAAEVARILSSELFCDDASLAVLYQAGTRYTHRFHETENLSGSAETTLKQHGVYLLTGGLGGLGLRFALHLAQNFKAKLVLTGRAAIESEQQAKLDLLRNAGAEVLYVQADVSRRTDVNVLIGEAKARFGHIDGVIHCAGITRDALIQNKTRDDVGSVLAPKVFGTIHLDDALADEPLDFMVTFSSTTALLGQVGLSDYGYANRFMDHFASWRERQRGRHKRSGKSISINWPLWRDGGMGLSAQGEELLFTATGMKAMSSRAGVEAFERALAGEANRLFVIAGDRNRIYKTLDLMPEPPAEVSVSLPAEENRPTFGHQRPAPQQLQKDLVQTVSAVLKIAEERINLDNNVSDYGFDSVSLVEFSNQLNRKYHLEITPTIFFEYPSLKAFSSYLLDEHSEAIARYYSVPERPLVDSKSAPSSETRNTTTLVSRFQRSSAVVQENPSLAEDVTYASNVKEPIAIIGMSGIMPQSEDLDAFWKHLEAGDDLITEIPSDRWDWKAYFGNPANEANKTNVKWGGFINDVDKFDARFFGISRREAEFMDPQQRIFLETVWKAIEDAGYKASDLAGQKVGVFAGVAGLDYGELMRDSGIEIEPYSTTGVFHCIVANRVSYLLNLTGPSVPVDTGCSSALVAIRQAIEAIWTGSCDMAIAGGVNALLSPSVFIAFGKAGMLSTDGRCKTFDKRANGYVRAEGAGVLLLKPLSKAIADRDNIHAIIRGSAVNHGGRVNTLTAPNPNAQSELIQKAFAEGDVDPTTVSYIEAHGTGTALGDPIEINGLKKAFREMIEKRGLATPEKPFCGIGAVKTNTGHLETAAAMAGIFKIILGMKHNTIPASIHLNEVNPYIQLENTPLYLVDKNRRWERKVDADNRELPRRAGVSSFGFGGVSG
ncbi:MAG TPA: SDR family NAD(P)-dependent oxidoreductase, partial [Pyrinomonadaceae bacterium]|nr:SDR family NAD(P)-dependent oxidoreductase [Pyrinomonadaceae bacterium]